jgi:hypothetical protein
MIYQLVRLEWGRSWRGRLIFCVILWGVVFALLIPTRHLVDMPEGLLSKILSSVLMPMVMLITCIFGGTRRASLFHAALPIPARDLFIARLLSLLAAIWFLILAIAGASYVVGHAEPSISVLPLIAASAVSTLAVLVLLSARLQELSAPRGLANWLLFPFLLAGTLVSFVRPGIVLVVCGGTIAALLWRDLALMPKAFQVAPAEAITERPSRCANGSPRPVWWPLFRSMFARHPSFMLLFSMFWLLTPRMSAMAGVLLASFVCQGWGSFGWSSMGWVWALPVSRRKVLALGLLPPLVLEAAVEAAKPAGLIQALAWVAIALLSTSAILALYYPRRQSAGARFLAWTGVIVCVSYPLAIAIIDMFCEEHIRRNYWGSYTAKHLAAHLARFPAPILAILFAGTLAGFGALYWLVQRQFEAADFVPASQIRLDTGQSSG